MKNKKSDEKETICGLVLETSAVNTTDFEGPLDTEQLKTLYNSLLGHFNEEKINFKKENNLPWGVTFKEHIDNDAKGKIISNYFSWTYWKGTTRGSICIFKNTALGSLFKALENSDYKILIVSDKPEEIKKELREKHPLLSKIESKPLTQGYLDDFREKINRIF